MLICKSYYRCNKRQLLYLVLLLVSHYVACAQDVIVSEGLRRVTITVKQESVRVRVNNDGDSQKRINSKVRFEIDGGDAKEGVDYYTQRDAENELVSLLIVASAKDGSTILFRTVSTEKDTSFKSTFVIATIKKVPANAPGLYVGIGASLNFEGDSPFFLGGFYGDVRLAFEDDTEKDFGWGIDLGLTSAKALPYESVLRESYYETRLRSENERAVVDSFQGDLTAKTASRSYTVFANNLLRISRFPSTLSGVTRLYIIVPRIEAGLVQSATTFDSSNVAYQYTRTAETNERPSASPIGEQGDRLAGYLSAELGVFLHMTREDGLDVRLGMSAGYVPIFRMGYYGEVDQRIDGAKFTTQFYVREPLSGITISSDVSYFCVKSNGSPNELFARSRYLCNINLAKSFSLAGLF